MYYLVDVIITRPKGWDEKFQRLVKAKDKNDACDKIDKYLSESYISFQHEINEGVTYDIKCNDTIV